MAGVGRIVFNPIGEYDVVLLELGSRAMSCMMWENIFNIIHTGSRIWFGVDE